LSKLWHWKCLRKRNQKLKIGILNDIPQGEDEGWEHTNVCYDRWKEEILRQAKNNKIEVKLLTVEDNFDSYTTIVNPYGGVYPEHSLGELETLNKMLDYVREGGFFVNVADIPGYYAYNKLIKRKLDVTPPAFWDLERDPCSGRGKLIPRRVFDLTPLMVKIGLRGYNVDQTGDLEFEGKCKEVLGSGIANIKVRRVLVVEKNVKSVVKPDVEDREDSEKRTPILFAKYGNGKFLFSLIWFDGQDFGVEKKLVSTLAKLIVYATQHREGFNR
jgi:hypothetical protein